jgi:hypothetical protein
MKLTIKIYTIMAALLLAACATQAQTGSFFQSAQGYFTSFNTNLTTFSAHTGECWTGVDQSQDTLSAVLGLSVDVSKSFIAEAVFRNANVAGTLLTAGAGGAYRIVKFDTQILLGFDAGYRFDTDKPYVEPFVDLRKALSENTYAGLRLYYQQEIGGSADAHAPGVLVIAGFKF